MKGIRLAVGSTLILLALIWGVLQMNQADARASDRAMAAFDAFVSAENGLHRGVLGAHSGLLGTYDPLVRDVAAMRDALDRLARSDPDGDVFAREAAVLRIRAGEEEALVERFKTANARLRNSLAYFSRLSGEDDRRAPDAACDVDRLATAVLHIVVDPSPARLAQVDAEIARIEPLDPGRDPGLAALVAHARQLRLLLPEMNAVLDALAVLGAGNGLEATRAVLLARQATIAARGDAVRLALYAIALVLVCLLAWAGAQLRARIDALQRRARLEHVVATISQRFLNTPSWRMQAHLALALEELALGFGATRAWFITPGGPERTVTFAQGDAPFPESWLDDAVAHMAGAGLGDGGVIHIEDVRAKGGEAARRLAGAGVASWICIARIGADGAVQAVLGFDSARPRAFRASGAEQLLALAFDALTNAVAKSALEAERERLEAHLQHARRMETVGVFASGIAHNFNNIIGAIMGHAEMATGEVQAGSRIAGHLDAIRLATERARDLADQVLGFGRRGDSLRRPVRLDPIIAETVSLLETSLPPQARLVVEPPPGPLVVQADTGQLQQVILNLCRNASEAMDGGGRITLGARATHLDAPRRVGADVLAPGGYIVIAIEDHGSGIDATTLARIFEPFFTTRRRGNGLGLTTALEIVRDHRGAIAVASTPGVGARFEVWLPAAPADMVPVEERSAGAALDRGGGEAVMLVERDPARRMRLEDVLAALGYEPVAFAEGARAVAAARAAPDRFDAAVILSGHGASAGSDIPDALHAAIPRMPIILSVDDARRYGTERMTHAGIAEVIPNPPTSAQLADALATGLRARRAPRARPEAARPETARSRTDGPEQAGDAR